MKGNFMHVFCLQTNPQENYEENIKLICHQVRTAQQQGAQVVVLPEMFSYMGSESKRKETKSNINEGVFLTVQNLAKELNLILIAGSHSETIENNNDKVFNTSVCYDSKGSALSIYRKLHLFNLKDREGKKIYCEEDVFEIGAAPKSFELQLNNETWNALTIICYDIRFPEIIRNLKSTIDVLFVPAAFTWQTGQDHWEVLLRARAIENQCYVVACNQTGFHSNQQKRNYGNSMIINPWGVIESRLGEEVGLLSGLLSKENISESRRKLPALADRKII